MSHGRSQSLRVRHRVHTVGNSCHTVWRGTVRARPSFSHDLRVSKSDFPLILGLCSGLSGSSVAWLSCQGSSAVLHLSLCSVHSHHHYFNPSSWQVAWSPTFSLSLTQWQWPCCWSLSWQLLLLLSPPTKGPLREPTAWAGRRRKALEWRCGAWHCRLQWRGWFKSLLPPRKRATLWALQLAGVFSWHPGTAPYNWNHSDTVGGPLGLL